MQICFNFVEDAVLQYGSLFSQYNECVVRSIYRVVFSVKIWYKGRKSKKQEGVVPDFNLQFATALTFYYRTKRFV